MRKFVQPGAGRLARLVGVVGLTAATRSAPYRSPRSRPAVAPIPRLPATTSSLGPRAAPPGLGTVNGAKFVPALAAEAGGGNTRART